jgi:hypothetical protein
MLDYNLNLKSNFDAKSAFKMGSDLAKKGENFLDPKMPRILRYPLAAIDKSQDMLLIRIYNNVTNMPGKDDITTVTDIKDASGKTIRSDVNFAPIKSKSDRFNESEVGKELEKNARYIYLPIPQQVTDSLTVGYAEDTLNPLQAAGMALASKGITDPGKAAGAIGRMIEGATKGINKSDIDALTTVLAGKAINQLGANVNPQSLITRSSGQILQSNLELLFSNVTLRTFPFVFDFTPRDPQEAQIVKDIIRTIKRATVAKKGGGLFINSPDLFQFQYIANGNQDHPFLNKFKVGVLENISVDYTASGTYSTYSDKTPVHIRMSLTMKEINPVYAEDYDDEPTGVGF